MRYKNEKAEMSARIELIIKHYHRSDNMRLAPLKKQYAWLKSKGLYSKSLATYERDVERAKDRIAQLFLEDNEHMLTAVSRSYRRAETVSDDHTSIKSDLLVKGYLENKVGGKKKKTSRNKYLKAQEEWKDE